MRPERDSRLLRAEPDVHPAAYAQPASVPSPSQPIAPRPIEQSQRLRYRPAGRGPSSRARARAGADASALGRILRHQEHDLRRADRRHRSVAARASSTGKRARRNPRHRQRDHRAQERGDVDRRAGGAARGHLQRRSRATARSSRCWPATTSPTSWSTAPTRDLHRSRRQDPADQHPLPRQRAADEHLPAHRQPGRPPRRRSSARSATRACPTARASTSSRRRWRSTARRSPSASSRRTS